ncbi:glycosyltransferase family 4 protein [Aestuariibacter halophilus]|uniref:Glycosyltransferase family 4 protein n=1 Tax=Fluctibacter halophilus TaxID=226011 RepID=A0ABS8G2Q3_9ALTE|nr:glycosyltransferase family 4 protein [Aestuariibacter halophilus]MCC2614862.1 glycosyltransferase family 4 protein [Aestuariibacter halophilus]
MKILYHHRVASKDGQYVHIEEINKGLLKAGHEIVLVAPSMGEEQEFGGDGGLVSKLKKALPQALYEMVEFAYSFWAFLKLAVAIIKHRPDIIYERYNLFNPAGVWAKKWFGIPLLLEINAPLLEERNKYDGIALFKLARWTEHYTWRNADWVLPVTDVLASYQRDIGIPESRIRVIPNGINWADFTDPSIKNPLERDVSDFTVVGFVGFCREWHGLDKILSLMTEPGNEKLFFLLVGDGPAVPGIKAQAESLGLTDRIHITGLVKRDAMPGWLLPMDIALQPAVVAYASPLKMLEYMATGKAIVAPRQANIEELLTDGENALMFDTDDQQTFIDACNRLVKDDELRARLSAAARDTVLNRDLTWDNNCRIIIDLAERSLKGTR